MTLAIDLFNLVGRISVNYADAVHDIDRVSDAADDAAESLDDMGDAADDAENPVRNSGNAADDANGKFSTWKMTLANLASSAIQNVIGKCTDLAKNVVQLGMDFSSTMSEVQAISGASTEQMEELEATARQYGATTVFSATEAAEALKYMSLAGWSVEESTSALGGVLDLAAASGMGLGQASDMVTDYLSAFGMEADKASYFADMLAFAQSNSNTTAEQLGEAYRNCAANLNAAGQDVETTTSLLEAMANQGYKGSEAGTALAAIMRDITKSMEDGSVKIGDTVISVMDANGNFRDLTDILTDVENATNGVGDAERAAALSTTFTADSTKGLNLLLNEGMQNVASYEEALRGADGAASEMAETMNDNLKGDLANMNSAFEELQLKIFDGLEQPLRKVVQFITNGAVPAIENIMGWLGQFCSYIGNVDNILSLFSDDFLTAMDEWIYYLQDVIQIFANNTIDMFMSKLQGISELFQNFGTVVQPIVETTLLTITRRFDDLLVIWNDVLVPAISFVIDAFLDLSNAILTHIAPPIQKISEKINELQRCISAAIQNYIVPAIQAFIGMIQSLWEENQDKIELIGQLFQAVFERIASIVSWFVDIFKNYIYPLFAWLSKTVVSNMDKIKAVFQSVFDIIGGIVKFFVALFKGDWGGMWDAVISILGGAVDYIQNWFELILSLIGSIISPIVDKISGIFESIVSIIGEKIQQIRDSISEKFEAVKQVVIDVFTSVRDTLSNIWETIKNVIQVAIMFIVEIIKTAFELITLPWRFIWENCKEYILAAWDTIKSAISDALNTIQTTISDVWNAITSFLNPILEGIKNTVSDAWNTIKFAVLDALDTIKTNISNIWNKIKNIVADVVNEIKSVISDAFNSAKSTVTDILSSIKNAFSDVWNGISSIVSDVINNIKDTIGNGINGAKNKVTDVLNGIKNAFSDAFNGIKSFLSPIINWLKGIFDFNWSLPKIKLPHFSISGNFSLSPPSIPHFSIDWYAKAMEDGMIMNQPTIFGYNAKSNQFLAGGEAGSETVVGTESLMSMIKTAVSAENIALIEKFDKLINLLGKYFPEIISMQREVVLDTGVLVGELAPKMDTELGKIMNHKGRGN